MVWRKQTEKSFVHSLVIRHLIDMGSEGTNGMGSEGTNQLKRLKSYLV